MTNPIALLDSAASELSNVTLTASQLAQAEQDVWYWLGKETVFYGDEAQVIAEWEVLLDEAVKIPQEYAAVLENVSELVHEVNQHYLSMICNG